MTPDKMVNLDLRISQHLPNFAQQNNTIDSQNLHFQNPQHLAHQFNTVSY